jgi:hypothetical protein
MSDIAPPPGRAPDLIDIDKIEKRGVPKPERPIEEKDRITADFRIHHEHCCDGNPLSIVCQFSQFLKGKEVQPYSRRIKVTEEWKPIDLGWVKNEAEVGYIFLDYKKDKVKQKTSDEREEPIGDLLVSCREPARNDLAIPYGQGLPLFASFPEDWKLKSSKGVINIWVTVFPR